MSDLLNRDTRRTARATARSRGASNGPTPDQSRMLASVALKTSGVVLVVAAAVVIVTLVAANSELTGTLGAIAGSWFAVHQVPLTIGGTSLGVAPLLPTLVVMWAVARTVQHAVDVDTERRVLGWVFAASLAGPIGVTAIALAVAKDASTVIGLASPNALVAFAWVAGVHAVASGIGLGLARWHSVRLLDGVPDWIRALVAPLVRVVAVFVAGGAIVLSLTLVASWETVGTLVESGRDFVGMLGLTVVSVLYLPNVIIGTLAVVTGSTSSIGDASASLFSTTGGALPPLPILAIFPEGAAQSIWVVMLVVPVAAGILLGRDCAIRSVDFQVALSSVWVVAAVVGLFAGLFGYAAGGNLGTFGTVEVTVWSFALLTFAWLAVVGSVSAAIVVWRRPEPEPEPEAEPKPEDAPEPEAELSIEPIPAGPVVDAEVVDAEVVEEPAAAPVKPESVAAENADAEPLEAEVVAPPEVVEEPSPVVEEPSPVSEEPSDTDESGPAR